MNEASVIGLDLAQNVLQAHGAAADGSVVFRRKLTRLQIPKFFAEQRRCAVAMEACASAAPFWPAEERHEDYAVKNPLMYRYYLWICGRDQRVSEISGDYAG